MSIRRSPSAVGTLVGVDRPASPVAMRRSGRACSTGGCVAGQRHPGADGIVDACHAASDPGYGTSLGSCSMAATRYGRHDSGRRGLQARESSRQSRIIRESLRAARWGPPPGRGQSRRLPQAHRRRARRPELADDAQAWEQILLNTRDAERRDLHGPGVGVVLDHALLVRRPEHVAAKHTPV